jgi:DNA-binding PadR family transcriptional regulator
MPPDPANPTQDPADLVILSLLAEGPMYGYAIAKEVSSRSDGALRLTPGVLYPLLKQLETDGLILSSWETVRSDRSPAGEEDRAQGTEGQPGGRKRKWYRLSAKGRKRLAQRIAAHRAYRAVIDLFIPAAPNRKRRDGEEAAS